MDAGLIFVVREDDDTKQWSGTDADLIVSVREDG